jgi:uncharacterized protein
VPNRLANETSPYLLQHADNPVDWYPWGDDALVRARELNRPILLSIGYSACHWCHVMERESFEDAAIAQLMNDGFVPVKVDREERPDLDAVYMQAVVHLTGHGGWPMTVFLTPEGEPFWGGTYFPPEPRHGMPSFRQVLEGVGQAYRERRDEVGDAAAQLSAALRAGWTIAARDTSELRDSLFTDALLVMRGQLDQQHGGFGGAPKFPPHAALPFLLRMHRRLGSDEALRMARLTLDRMAAGGIRDQVGGGFHRYAVDALWLVPHFEKMLYDNALLASAYLQAHAATGSAAYRQVAEETLDYLRRELLLEHGGFASAQDADTDGEEGLTYTWTPDELREVLGDEAALVETLFGVTPAGNFEGRTVLSRVLSLEDAAARSGVAAERLPVLLARLHEARDRRPQPARDDKALAAWNGMALAAFAEAHRLLRRPEHLQIAVGCAEFLLGTLSAPDGSLYRTHRAGRSAIPAFLDDYAQVSNGLWHLYLATGEQRWLRECRRLALLAVERFADEERGGFYETPQDGEQLVARPKELDDNPTPSGNATLGMVLLRLARLDDDAQLEERAARVVRLLGELLQRAPVGFGAALSLFDALQAEPRTLAIVGQPADALARAALGRFDPDLAVAFGAGDDDGGWQPALLAGKPPVEGRAEAYLCRGTHCLPPTSDPEELEALLGRR